MPAYLYAARLADGRVKIGFTENPSVRLPALRHKLGPIDRFETCEITGGGWARNTERAALDRLARAGNHVGGEVFACVQFGQALTLIRQMARRRFDMHPPSQGRERTAFLQRWHREVNRLAA